MKRFWMIFIFGIIGSGCSTIKGSRFELYEEYQLLDLENDSYEEYQKEVEVLLRNNWMQLLDSDIDLPSPNVQAGINELSVERLVAAQKPTNRRSNCEFKDGKPRGMLLIHGLYDSPYIMRDLEEYFIGKCFHTRSVLLPGHGTRPGNLLRIDYTAWIGAVDFAAEQLSKEVDKNIYIAGFSTGGALALNSALDSTQIKGIFLFAPALELVYWHARLLKIFNMDWVPFQRFEDKDMLKYESMTLNSVIEVGELISLVRKKLDNNEVKMAIPVLLVVAKNDYTVPANKTIELYKKGQFGDKSEMLIYAPVKVDNNCSKGVIPGDSTVTPKIPTYINSCFVHRQNGNEYLIADYSHMALTLKSTDDHYGLDGTYKYCLQYFSNKIQKNNCESLGNTISDICFGEREAFGSRKYSQCKKRGLMVRRLTSNPQFDGLATYMDQFVDLYIDVDG